MDAIKKSNDRGFGRSAPGVDEEIAAAARAVEAMKGTTSPARSKGMQGVWSLVYTTSPAMLKNKGVTGFGAIPGTRVGRVAQTIDMVRKEIRTCEKLFFLACIPSTNSIQGTLEWRGDQRTEFQYEHAMFGPFKLVANMRGAFDTTYLSSSLRISRSTSGQHIFVFVKEPLPSR